jgi:flagellar hook protein FlgE
MLGSVTQTALTALSAIGSAVQVSANNLANAGTTGFKSAEPTFAPRTGSAAEPRVVSGALEPSDTDIARELVNLNNLSNFFRANVEVLRASDALLDDLLNLNRGR